MTKARNGAEVPCLLTDADRAKFDRRIDRTGPLVGAKAPGHCWIWTGRKTKAGYGQFTPLGGRTEYAHRVMFALAFGLPGKMFVLHRCDNPPCVNPAHLFAGTAADNAEDCRRKWRGKQSVRHPSDVPLIRARLATGEPVARIAEDFGISKSTTYNIRYGLSYGKSK